MTCRWVQKSRVGLIFLAVSEKGLYWGMVFISHSHLYSQHWPTAQSGTYYIHPENVWWACSTGLTTCVHSTVLNTTKDFCAMVQMVPHLIYHPHRELLQYWNGATQCQKRGALIVLTVSLFLGLGIGGAATGASALALQVKKLWEPMEIHGYKYQEDWNIQLSSPGVIHFLLSSARELQGVILIIHSTGRFRRWCTQ